MAHALTMTTGARTSWIVRAMSSLVTLARLARAYWRQFHLRWSPFCERLIVLLNLATDDDDTYDHNDVVHGTARRAARVLRRSRAGDPHGRAGAGESSARRPGAGIRAPRDCPQPHRGRRSPRPRGSLRRNHERDTGGCNGRL